MLNTRNFIQNMVYYNKAMQIILCMCVCGGEAVLLSSMCIILNLLAHKIFFAFIERCKIRKQSM